MNWVSPQITSQWPFTLLLGFAVVVTALLYGAGRLGAGPDNDRDRFPDFELETVAAAGHSVTAASLSRRPALVNVWASWCLACRDEHALLMALAESKRIALYGVNYRDERQDAIRWLDYFGDPFELSVYDRDGILGRRLGVEVVPGTYLLGADGRILYRHVGPLDQSVLDTEIWPRVMAREAGGE